MHARSEAELVEALQWARDEDIPAVVLGAGSNVVIADEGFHGLVVCLANGGVEVARQGDEVLLTAGAGEPWDALVARCVKDDLAGLECLSGIPGLTGATPIQNVGAYGQEVSEVIDAVRVLDRVFLKPKWLTGMACDFSYRDSYFKRHPDRYVVLAVRFRLVPGGRPAVRYPELQTTLALRETPASLQHVRDAVLSLRRAKSMVIAREDPNRRSVGSFFTNPVVTLGKAREVIERALRDGLIQDANDLPQFPAGNDRVKLAAGWLIEKVGISKGLTRGHVGVSSNHSLALVHHGGGTTAELIELGREIRDRVEDRFGVRLVPEPVFLGFPERPI